MLLNIWTLFCKISVGIYVVFHPLIKTPLAELRSHFHSQYLIDCDWPQSDGCPYIAQEMREEQQMHLMDILDDCFLCSWKSPRAGETPKQIKARAGLFYSLNSLWQLLVSQQRLTLLHSSFPRVLRPRLVASLTFSWSIFWPKSGDQRNFFFFFFF